MFYFGGLRVGAARRPSPAARSRAPGLRLELNGARRSASLHPLSIDRLRRDPLPTPRARAPTRNPRQEGVQRGSDVKRFDTHTGPGHVLRYLTPVARLNLLRTVGERHLFAPDLRHVPSLGE